MGNGDGTFKPPVLYTTVFTDGAGPVMVGEFTGDGKQDVIVFSKNAAEGELFKGNGDGTFQPGVTFATPENVFNAAAVDLNGDGKLDLVLTGTNSGKVYVMLGNGNGTFQPAQGYQTMAGTNIGVPGLAVADFNTGNLDIIVTAASRGVLGSRSHHAAGQRRRHLRLRRSCWRRWGRRARSSPATSATARPIWRWPTPAASPSSTVRRSR